MNRGTLCLKLLLGAVKMGSSRARQRADGRQKERQIKWAGVGEEHRQTLRAAEMCNPHLMSVEGGLRENRVQLTIKTGWGRGVQRQRLEGRRVFLGFCGSIVKENHTNAQLILTLITCPGTLSFPFLHFLFMIKYIFSPVRTELSLIQQVDI